MSKRRVRNRLQSTFGIVSGLGSAAGAPVDAATYIAGGALSGPANAALSGPDGGDPGTRGRDRSARAARRAAKRAGRG
jgi:hypothetical protein